MLVRGGRIHAAARHLERLAHSVAALYGTRLPRDLAMRIRAEAAPLRGEHRLRVDAIPGAEVTITTHPIAPGHRAAVTLEPLVIPGGLGPHKWRDRRLLDARPAHPAPLILDADHTVLEAAWGNFWVREDDRLITPPADGRILPGVTRDLLLERAASLGLRAAEEPISLERARGAEATFATSAIRLAVAAGIAGVPAPPVAPVDRIRGALS
jgi:para-aminobenzoate synthetase / 4-amino-4-deoxychorismate lyase